MTQPDSSIRIELISKPDMRVFVVDGLLSNTILTSLLSKFPDTLAFNQGTEDPSVYAETCAGVGSQETANAWNTPKDEGYFKQGVIVKSDDPPAYFKSEDWKNAIAKIIGLEVSEKLEPVEWKYKTHLKKTNGIWLHTDKDLYLTHPNIDAEDPVRQRSIEILIYTNKQRWEADYGGNLLLFSNTNSTDFVSRKCIEKYQYNRPLTELHHCNIGDVIRTTGIGGCWHSHKTAVDFTLEKKVAPLFGRVVVLDYREHYNVHALSPKIAFNRKLIEQWFTVRKSI